MNTFDVSITVPAGTYVLGDPCYTVEGTDANGVDHWQGWLERVGIGDIMVGEVPGTDYVVVAFSTAYGDGCWPLLESGVKTDHIVGADAGMLGLVPVEYAVAQGRTIFRDVVIVNFDRATKCSVKKDGTLKFGRYSVRTGW